MRTCRSLADRFWEKVDKTTGYGPWGDCWLWTAALTTEGYGRFSLGRRGDGNELAHRVAFTLERGRPPAAGLFICHRCDVRDCVNDAHLFEGTNAENLADMTAKGRRRFALDALSRPGAANPSARLTDDAVREILSSTLSGPRLASQFGVSSSCVWLVRANRSWKHLPRTKEIRT